MNSTKEKILKLSIGSLLIGITYVITTTFPKVPTPAGSFTLGFHVPLFIAMVLGTYAIGAAIVGEIIGFIQIGIIIAIPRVIFQIPALIVGMILLKKNVSLVKIFFITLILHSTFEALAILIFGPLLIGDSSLIFTAVVSAFIGTAIQHVIDFGIFVPIYNVMKNKGILEKLA